MSCILCTYVAVAYYYMYMHTGLFCKVNNCYTWNNMALSLTYESVMYISSNNCYLSLSNCSEVHVISQVFIDLWKLRAKKLMLLLFCVCCVYIRRF